MKVLLVTVVTLTTAIVLCSAADPECKLRMQKGLPPHWPNPSDCGRFYRCTPKNVKREVICPPEREYNQKTGKCALRGKGTCNLSQIAPAADDTDVCNGQPDNTFLPRQGYCRDFYVCSGNAATLNSCVVGTIYNAAIEGCVTDETDSCWQNQCVGVTDNTWRPIATSCLSYYICNANDATLQFCNSGSYFDLGENACIPDVGNTNCWENFCLDKVTGANIPNADDCHSYYTCNDQVSVQETCQDGYYFDTNTLECLVGDCPIETCTCPGGYEAGEMLPHPTDCTRFYICDNSKLLEQSCPVGTYFDCNVKACEQGTCAAITTPNKKKRSLLDMNTSEIETDIEDNKDVIPMDAEVLKNEKTLLQLHETISNVPVSAVGICDGRKDNTVLVHPERCDLFYICLNEKANARECVETQWFDPSVGYCVHDTDAICRNPCESIKGIAILPYPTDCTKFYFCNYGTTKIQSGISNANLFEEIGLCIPGLNNCGAFICAGQADGKTFPVQGDYTKFYYCRNGEAIEAKCDPGSEYVEGYGCQQPQSDPCDQTVCQDPAMAYTAFGSKDNPHIFCYCEVTTSRWAAWLPCDDGLIFDTTFGVCWSGSGSILESINPVCDVTLCSETGTGTIIPAINDQHGFCYCTSSNKAEKHSCKPGIFDHKTQSCTTLPEEQTN